MSEAFTILRDAPLRDANTLRVAATARWLATVRDPSALPDVLGRPEFAGLPVLVLGEGSNVLFATDFAGLVLRPSWRRARIIGDESGAALVRAEAGQGWDALVDWSLAQGLAGLENLALIPGLVGAAPIQNIGAYGAEVGEFITAVEAFDQRLGATARVEHARCGFGYRDSVFKREPDRWIITAIELRLPRSRAPNLGYSGVREELAAMGHDQPTPAQVAQAVRRLRRRKLPDPAVIGNAGSFFKNPVVPAALAEALRAAHPGMPVHPADGDARKLSAAWLIEACGWRGFRDGDAGISAQHSLVLVNHGRASGLQLLDLARRVADSVEQRFGVRLEPEPRIVGARF
ncbi:MAG TPA: UDP-N-acetylmuramate dehydrogenase [Steroidobacteraceae bacterium]|nr:UDP-N-acetylmuramate dehydrogenase [Steroidobacteraceae bacterium]